MPNEKDQTVYLVANDFGKPDRAWAEAEYERTDVEALTQDPLTGQYSNPIRVVAFNTGRTLVRGGVRQRRADQLRRCCDLQMPDISFFLLEFTDRYEPICRYHEPLMSLIGFRCRNNNKAATSGSSDIVFTLDRVQAPDRQLPPMVSTSRFRHRTGKKRLFP